MPNKDISPYSGSFFSELAVRAKLILRLMADGRVNLLLKALPVASTAYFFFPIDIPGPLDDLAIVALGFYLFVELAPEAVVQEHLKKLHNVVPGDWAEMPKNSPSASTPPTEPQDVVDGDFQDLPDEPQPPDSGPAA